MMEIDSYRPNSRDMGNLEGQLKRRNSHEIDTLLEVVGSAIH